MYLEVGDVRQAQAQPRPRPRHDVACPSINMDLVEAEVHREAGLPGAGAAALRPGPIEEQPRARDLKGCW